MLIHPVKRNKRIISLCNYPELIFSRFCINPLEILISQAFAFFLQIF